MASIPPSYLSTAFSGYPGTALAGLGSTTGVSLNGAVPFTVQLLVNFDALGSNGILFGQTGVFTIANVFETIVVTMAGRPVVATDPSLIPLTTGVWHFVAVAFDGISVDIYIDLVPAIPEPTNGQALQGNQGWSNAPFTCGSGFKGRIRGIQLFRYAKLQSDLDPTDFDATPGNYPSELVQYFNFGTTTPCTLSGFPLMLGTGVEVVASVIGLNTAGAGWALPVNDVAVNPAGDPTSAYTVQAWLKVTAPVTAPAMTAEEAGNPLQTIFANYDPSGNGGGMSLQVAYNTSDPMTVDLTGQHGSGNDAIVVSAPATLTVNEWANVALVFDGTTLTLFVNGMAQTAAASVGATIPGLSAGFPCIAGIPASQMVGMETLQGALQGVSVWSAALDSNAIVSNMTAVPDLTSGDLVAYYDLVQPLQANAITQAPVALLGGAAITDQPDPTLPVAAVLPVQGTAPTDVVASGDAALLARLRDSVDRRLVAARIIAHVEQVRTELTTLGISDTPLTRGARRRADREIDKTIATARRDPFRLPTGVLMLHEEGDEVFLVKHFSDESVILVRFTAGSPNCTYLSAVLTVEIVLLLLTVFLGFGGQGIRRYSNTILSGVLEWSAENQARVVNAINAVLNAQTSLPSWGNLLGSILNTTVITQSTTAIMRNVSWVMVALISTRIFTFTMSWPAQVVLLIAQLVTGLANVIEAKAAYTSQCGGNTLAETEGRDRMITPAFI